MKTAIAIAVIAGAATAANAQFFEMVINTAPNDGADYAPGTTIEYSMFLRDGGSFTNFVGWSSFAGRSIAPGSHNLPVENATDTNNSQGQPDNWEGRRAPAQNFFPGGSSGGFRFSPQTYFAIPNGLEGNGGLAYEGLAASVPLGGFQQDGSPDLEVFRGSFVADVVGTHLLQFVAVDAAYFAGDFSTTVIGVQSSMGNTDAAYTVTPTPASLALLGLGLVARRRRH